MEKEMGTEFFTMQTVQSMKVSGFKIKSKEMQCLQTKKENLSYSYLIVIKS